MKIKNFKKVYNYNVINNLKNIEKINLKFILNCSEDSTSLLAPILGQYQIPTIDFQNSYTKSVSIYNENFENIIKIIKIQNISEFFIFPPKLTFLINNKFFNYGFELYEFIYDFKFLFIEDVWFLIVYFSNNNFISFFNSSKIIFSYFNCIENFKIIF